jgi:hypothetical protein
MTGTGRSVVAAQARAIADAWSPPGAPESWWLTAATFTTIAEDEPLLDVALARAEPARSVRGNLLDVLPDVVASLPAEALVCLVDTYVHVFLPPPDLERFDGLIAEIGRERDLEWVSVDPLVPLGPDARATVQRDGGVWGVIGRVGVRNGVRSDTVLGRAHPGAAWLEWR